MKKETDLLLSQLANLQDEYKVLLTRLKDTFRSDLKLSLDTIAVFWYKNKAIVEFALENLFCDYEAVMFTAGTYLKINKNEHYPLLTFGQVHIIDDPVCSYINTLRLDVGEAYKDFLLNTIEEAIDNNIKAIERHHDRLFVLPVRYIFETKNGTADEESDKAFLDQFQNLTTMNDFFALETYEDISCSLLPGVEKCLLLSEDDTTDNTLEERLNAFASAGKMPEQFKQTPAMMFFGAVYSRVKQTVNVFSVCYIYKIIPMIRDMVASYYLKIITDNIFPRIKDESHQVFQNRTNICYAYSHSFSSSSFKDIAFSKYKKAIDLKKRDLLWNDEKINSLTDLKEIVKGILNEECLC